MVRHAHKVESPRDESLGALGAVRGCMGCELDCIGCVGLCMRDMMI